MNNAWIKKLHIGRGIGRYFKENMGIIIAFIVLYLFLSLNPATAKAFLKSQNMFNQ